MDQAFDKHTPERCWTALISQHTKCGQPRQALKIYERMQQHGVKPSSNTLIAALKACSNLQDLGSCKQIHAHVGALGLDSDVFVGTMLMDVYAKCGYVVDARRVFEKMPHRTVVSWNAMILRYTQLQDGELALQLYSRMQQEGIEPDGRTFVAALKACSILAASKGATESTRKIVQERCLKQVRSINLDVVKRGLETDLFVGTMLADAYTKCGSIEEARHVFEKMPHRDAVSWNAMILGYAHMEDGDMALELYARMQQECVIPNHRTFVAALKACSTLVTADEGNQGTRRHESTQSVVKRVQGIHSDVVKSGCDSDVFVGTALVDVYAKCGRLSDARCVFEKMLHRNVVSWTAMILGYAQIGQGNEALLLFEQMQQAGVVPDDRTYVAALKACSSLASGNGDGKHGKQQCLEKVRAIHLAATKGDTDLDVFVGNVLVDVYAKCGNLREARLIFEKMQHRDVVAWNAMIFGYAQMEQSDVALQLYARMQKEGPAPDDLTFVAALKACGSVAALEKGEEIKARIFKTGVRVDRFVATALIDMYGKCGSMENARQVFDTLRARDVVPWNALIVGYAHGGDSKLVFDLYELMRQDGIEPNGITFLSVLTACSHVGLVHKGQKYFEAMRTDFGIKPTIEHYNCMVDLLARAGQLDDAVKMMSMMPYEPSGNVWRCVLSACQKWSNMELGRWAFEGAVRLDENDVAAYVLMSNIYMAAHMLEDAEEIQAMRAKLCSWKTPGHSWWTDMAGTVHAFAVGDAEHDESEHVYHKLQALSFKLREEGHGFKSQRQMGRPRAEEGNVYAMSRPFTGLLRTYRSDNILD